MAKRGRFAALLVTMTAMLSLVATPLSARAVVPAQAALPAGGSAAAPAPVPNLQTYSFTVPELLMEVTVLPDGSIRIVYDITFQNQGSPIDIVDIGTPNDNYDLSRMVASIDGHPLDDIRTSTYIDTGVEVHLEDYVIFAGDSGTLHMEFVSPEMVYADTTNEENASLQITPTWFDSDLIQDAGNIEIRVRMLPGIEPDEVLYQDEPFTGKYKDDRGNTVVVWRYENVRPTEAYRVGVSFPRRGISQITEVTFWDILGRWLGGVLPFVFGCIPILLPIVIVFLVVRGIIRAMKPNYLPPIAQVEGGGIKRGLTAPEAAALLEIPLTKVVTLVIFGMLQKGLIRQTDDDPLTVEVVEAFRVADRADLKDQGARRRYRRQMAQQAGSVIHTYEHPFLDLIEIHPDTPLEKMAVVKPTQELVDEVAKKMQGFDLSDTQDYYRRVIDRAMEQAAALGDIEQRETYLDRYLPWVMMRRDYRPVMTMGSYNYWPLWARQVRAAGAGAAVGAGRSRSTSSAGRASTSTFGDVSASFAGWTEATMGGMAAAILPTRLSKPVPVTHSSSSGGSSCACACAGCACACACAGGGR